MKNEIAMLIELHHIDVQGSDVADDQKKCSCHVNTDETLRERVKSTISPHLILLYEKLFKVRDGEALAKIEDGVCTACNVVLPTKEVNFIEEAKNIVQCWNCQRILYT